MKNLLLMVLMLLTVQLSAQSDKYQAAMTAQLAILDTAETLSTFQQLANNFERIAAAETTEWLPAYYLSLCHMNLAGYYMQAQDMERCNAHIDAAQQALDQASAIQEEKSEIYALQGYIYQGRIWENPMVKGAEFSPKSHAATDRAIALNPNNPRPYYLKGQNVLFTPEFYGGGAANALPLLQKADELYAIEQTNDLAPSWGKERNAYLLQKAMTAIESK